MPTRQQQRLAPDAGRDEIARISDLTLVADVNPGLAIDSLELKLENLRVGVEAAMNAAGLDQGTHVVAYWHWGCSEQLQLEINPPPAEGKGPGSAERRARAGRQM